MWVMLTRGHFDYAQYLTNVILAYQAWIADHSEQNLRQWRSAKKKFEEYRMHILTLDDEYTANWFPGYEQFANFLSADPQDLNAYYKSWRQRKADILARGSNIQQIGFTGAAQISKPFRIPESITSQ